MVMEVVQEDMGEDSMHCTKHPYKSNSPGGICAFCLQEKLGKLVSSSFPVPIFPSTSSSPSPSIRSDFGGASLTTTSTTTSTTTTTTTSSSVLALNSSVSNKKAHQYYSSRSTKFPFLSAQRRKKKKDVMMGVSDSAQNMVFQRSMSSTTPRNSMHFGDGQDVGNAIKKSFWSFLYSSSSTKHSNLPKKHDRTYKDSGFVPSSSSSLAPAGNVVTAPSFSIKINNVDLKAKQKHREEFIVLEENDLSPEEGSFDRKVSRSRSVGCGSRSFSGDFFERISTGLGDCTLRRVESQREGKTKKGMHRNGHDSIMKERVRCGGLFGGFSMITSSSSSSSSSSYWVSSSTEDHNMNGKTPASVDHHLAHSRTKNWGRAFASPMRAFSTKQTSNGKRTDQNIKNVTPNLADIPSILSRKS